MKALKRILVSFAALMLIATPLALAGSRTSVRDGIPDNTSNARELARRSRARKTYTWEELARRNTTSSARDLRLRHNANWGITYDAEALERFRRYQSGPSSWRDLKRRHALERRHGWHRSTAEELDYYGRNRDDDVHTAEELEAGAW